MDKKQYTEWCNKIFELIPEANFIAVDENDNFIWFKHKPAGNMLKFVTSSSLHGFLGNYYIDFPYEESLVERRWVPEVNELYYVPSLFTCEKCTEHVWRNNDYDKWVLQIGGVYEHRYEAIARAERMLGVELKQIKEIKWK